MAVRGRATLGEVPDQDQRTPAERAVKRAMNGLSMAGKPLPASSITRERTIEGYLLGQEPPAWMRRAREIERQTRRHEAALAAEHAALRERHGGDAAGFAAAWRTTAERWDFRELNDLVDRHNEWYPVERRLPVDPRTGEYVTVGGGRSYRRERLGAAWVLRRFPLPAG